MTGLFSKCYIDLSRSENIKSEIKKEFKDLFSISIPSSIRERACYERKLIQSIRYSLKKDNLILRRIANQNNIFYLGNMDIFRVKSNHYMEKNSDIYAVWFTINENNQQYVRDEIEKKIQLMNLELEKLYTQKRLTQEIYKKLRVNTETMKLPYLYFLPDPSTVRTKFLLLFLSFYDRFHSFH
jgi:hypothetical protein